MDALNTKLVYRFFVCFSRFECALKRSDFLKATGKNNRAEPDWEKYASSLDGCFDNVDDKNFRAAVKLLRDKPPQTQIVYGRNLKWKETPVKTGEIDEEYVLRLVRLVRNNLFHGGKYPTGPIEEPARNEDLLEAVITILNHCLTFNDVVRQAYDDVA